MDLIKSKLKDERHPLLYILRCHTFHANIMPMANYPEFLSLIRKYFVNFLSINFPF